MDTNQSNAGATSNSSDFVSSPLQDDQNPPMVEFTLIRNRMLEDPSYSSVVRWGDDGDSFVVLENEKFTKTILPKHFKHSNFASFVRQLNKYDFHKVRHNNEESGQSPYGPGAWEFKHPEFKANSKDTLDNIKRKAPAPRKPPQSTDDVVPTQQMDLVNTQLIATQHQLQQLQERYSELSIHHSMLLQELIGVQKTVVNHEHVMQNVMSFLHSVDARQRRDSRLTFHPIGNGNAPPTIDAATQQVAPSDEEPASPLQHASKLLNELNADVQLNYKNLEQTFEIHNRANGLMSTPPPDSASRNGAGSARPPTSAGSTHAMGYPKTSADLDNVVYPIGQTNGIDPMYSEHINNIPYPMPSKDIDPNDPRRAFAESRKRSTQIDPGWVRHPHVLLVEDDGTCRRIGGKFLYSFNCNVENALDGLEAVNKVNSGQKYDLILMDIIMPNLDGISACHLIRQYDTATPIIAMTSNIRSDDIEMYFTHGMNDVLPKPFTKEGLLATLEKHLGHLKKGQETIPALSTQPGTQPISHGSAGQSVKDESSPGQSPATLNNWQSPNQFQGVTQGVSPAHTNMSAQFLQPINTSASYNLDQNGVPYQTPQTPMSARPGPHRRQISDIAGPDDMGGDPKRQRMYGQPINPMTGTR
ncbi:MAG: kinase-regulated stress-responsive transcription factor skn7 [Cirrosporium novae-zelandiae]|nr:MAG: kinase-regulated stress-responsive transcription factor skn7 [Cirrosporium novae-zelandiae]